MRATVTPTVEGVNFSNVRLKIKELLLQASGRWEYLSPPHNVIIEGKCNTDNIGHTLKLLGFKDSITGAKGKGFFPYNGKEPRFH